MVALPAAASAEEADKPETGPKDPRAVGVFRYGAKGGLTLGTQTGRGARIGAIDDKLVHQGIALGGFATYRFAGGLAVQPELYLFEKGVDFDNPSRMRPQIEGLIYLELPVMGRYDLPLSDMFHLYGLAGPSIGYLVDSKLRDKSELKSFDFGVQAAIGADVKLGSHLAAIEVRAGQGFLQTLDLEINQGKAHNRFIAFLLGFTT
jgi:hypothetical protein